MSDPNLIHALLYVLDYLEDHADVIDGDEGQPMPNRAMRLAMEVEAALRKVGVDPETGRRAA